VSYTRRAIVEQAYAELALSGWTWDLSPGEMLWASQRLDMMLGAWDGEGIRLGMPIANSDMPPSLDDQSGCPAWAIEAVVLGLAVRLAAGKGKALSVQTTQRADSSMRSMRVRSAIPQPMAFPGGVPVGAGNHGTFTSGVPRDTLPVTNGGHLQFLEGQS
jgi:hypothetical protein